jgi:hypothetical protein
MQGSRSDTKQSPTVMCRCGSCPTVDAERPCTQMELVPGDVHGLRQRETRGSETDGWPPDFGSPAAILWNGSYWSTS